ncbi:MAG: SDR family oxidoreductase [Lentisphaerae bacterium]|nr:SDR family oxidoreductase [Lentisphaerota bacterium]
MFDAKILENSRIVVTGGAGFIGSNLTETLLRLGCEVVVLDNFATGKRENLARFSGHRNFTLTQGDIRNPDDCRKVVDGADFVLHQAALGSVPRSIKDPGTSASVNISGFVNMLHAAVDSRIKRFVYASSSSVYGDCQDSPKVEKRTGIPLSPYALTKSVNEQFAANFHQIYGIDCIGLRYFNVFGRRQDPDGAYAAVIPKFSAALIAHQSPVINGDGSFSRDFTFIDDVVKANILALTADDPAACNTVYNIAGGKETTLNELFSYLREELSVFDREIENILPVYAPERPGDIPHSLADISKAASLLGYIPEYDIRSGLKSTAQWYFQNLANR